MGDSDTCTARVVDTEKQETLTRAEIHDFGIQIVCDRMLGEGFEILGMNSSPLVTPQIIARKDGRLCHVIVRTAVYPNRGKLESEKEFFYYLKHAERYNALCYFAGVGICNASAPAGDGKETQHPVRGAGFHIDYDGLQVMTTLDRIRVRGAEGLRSLSSETIPSSGAGILERLGRWFSKGPKGGKAILSKVS